MVVQAKPKIANRCRNECLWCVRVCVCVCVCVFLIEIVLPVAAVFVCILAARWFQGASEVGSPGRLLAKRLSQSTGGPRKCRVLCACVCVCVFDAFYGATQPCCIAAARRGWTFFSQKQGVKVRNFRTNDDYLSWVDCWCSRWLGSFLAPFLLSLLSLFFGG